MKIHIVKPGDTLYELAQKYHIELDKLIASNPHIVNPDQIEVGMKVKIPTAPFAMAPAEGTYTFKHIVKQGDTLWKLSKAWDVPLSAMIAANPQLKNPNVLLTGEVVYIPKIGTDAAEPKAPVAAGEPETVQEPAPTLAEPYTPGTVPEAPQPAWEEPEQDAYPAEWHGMHAAWPPSAPGLQMGFPPEPLAAPHFQLGMGEPLHSPEGVAGAGPDASDCEPHMHMPHMPQAPLLAEPFAGVHSWDQAAVHPFAQADIPATEAFAASGQPELPHMPQQPFETYASPYGSYPYMAAPSAFEPAYQPHPYGGGHDCCSGPQLDVPGAYGYGPGMMPYAVPLAPLPDYAHGGMPAVPAGVDPAAAYTGGWQGYAPPYALSHPTPHALPHLSHPHQAAYPMAQYPYAPYGGVPGGPYDAHTSAAWEGAKVEEKEEEIDLTVDEDKAGVKAKSVSAQPRKKPKPQSPRDLLSEYLRVGRHRAPAHPDPRPNIPWINV